MSHSVVKVTESKPTDSLLLVVSEDGTVTPDKETVESYLNSRPGATELQVMHVNKFDGNNIDVTLDTLMYVHSEEVIEEEPLEMDQLTRNLMSFRMDHDYTPLTSPKRQSPVQEETEIDELAQTLSLLEGTIPDEPPKLTKIIKTPQKVNKKPLQQQTRQKAKMINTISAIPPKQPQQQQQSKTGNTPKLVKAKMLPEEIDSDDYNDDDFDDIDYEDDDNDLDFELEETLKIKTNKRTRGGRLKKLPESTPKLKIKTPAKPPSKVKQETPKIEKVAQEPKLIESKSNEKKTPPKKEKKVVKPPDDFALFSTPDIIRRVGGKEPTTPTTPVTPEPPKVVKPLKIQQETRSKSIDGKPKRISIENKQRSSTEDQSKRLSFEKTKNKTEKPPQLEKKGECSRIEGTVSVQGYDESIGSNSSESMLESQLEPLPSAEDIRAIIHHENTKTFTTSLVIPDSQDGLPSTDQNQTNLEPNSLDIDQSILDNINTDLISEDILYQVAQSLADNPELQNVIDKSIVDGNLMLDSALQPISQDNHLHHSLSNITQSSSNSPENQTNSVKGTQIIRSDGRILVLPPIERPTTRSRNKRSVNPEVRHVIRPVKPLDEEHVSGNELDSSAEEQSEEDESEDDPNKLWCICNQPHNNRFMICCDTCEEWYHGKCVNVTKAMGQMMEQEGKEWICLYCKDPSLKRPSAAARRIRKASRTSTDSGGSQRKSSNMIAPESPKTPACIVCGKPSRNSSIYCSDGCILKHAQGVEKVVVFERKTGKILSGANAPSAANLDKWLLEHPGFEVVRSTSKPSAVKSKVTARSPEVIKFAYPSGIQKMAQSKLHLVKNNSNDGVSLAIQRKGVNIGVLQHQPKQQQNDGNKLQKKITGLKIISKQASSLNQPKQTKLIQPVPVIKPQPATPPVKTKTPTAPPKTPTTPSTPKEKPMPQKTPKARQAEVPTSTVAQPKMENIRENVRKTLMEQLMNRIKMADDLKLTEDEVTNISTEIENQLFKCFGDTGQKYRNKYRSLIFNIKDTKNQTLWRRICEKSINPYQLVRLSPDDLASQELALWREREAKHQLDMIKKSELELLNCNRQYVFKTHKGEQVFEDDRPKDQTVTEVITGLGADSTSVDKDETKKESTKDRDRKSSKHKKDRSRDKDRRPSKEKNDSKSRRKDRKSSSRDRDKDRDRRKRSRSREHGRYSDRKRSHSRDRDRHRRSHKSSRHKKDVHITAEKLDKKSKEILEQLVDKQIVRPLEEDRLWKHVPQEDILPAANVESDSDHEPTSTVTIPTPPRSSDADDIQTSQATTDTIDKIDKKDISRSISIDSTATVSSNEDINLSPIIRPQTEHIWKGTINMVDVAQISITAHEVSGDCNGLSDELPSSLDIVGRISPDTVWDYIGKMRCSNSKMISLLRLNATNIEEKMPYIALYSYLSSRGRLGVVKSTNKAVKDFYVFPLGSQTPIPQALLPINGPGFEESRPPLLVGVIVRDKRKRPMPESTPPVIVPKKIKVEVAIVPPGSSTPPMPATPAPTRSYTPPPNRDPRIKAPYTPAAPLPTPPVAAPSPVTTGDDMDEPYSPEDSDPEAITPPLPVTEPPRLTSNVPVATNPPKPAPAPFLENTIPAQTFKPFTNKFDSIPGLEDPAPLLATSVELQQKMLELDQRIAMHKAEIDNMSQDIVSATTSDIGTSALANIALPSNLKQILDSIKTGAPTNEAVETQPNKNAPQTDLTIPLMLPKISSRTVTGAAPPTPKLEGLFPTIPLNLPKIKSKHSVTNSPQRLNDEKPASVLSSLSEEDLIRKAEEMLGEREPQPKKTKEKEILSPSYNSSYSTIFNTPPPVILPPTNVMPPAAIPPPVKRSKIDLNQPPIPGLEDEC